jgi:hypothetical protein
VALNSAAITTAHFTRLTPHPQRNCGPSLGNKPAFFQAGRREEIFASPRRTDNNRRKLHKALVKKMTCGSKGETPCSV